MNIVLRAPWIRSVVFCVSVAVAACGGPTGPTGGTTPTPAPTPTPVPVTACTAGAPQPMTSFTTNPATITDGDTFTLSWAAPCGFVSLAQKGQGPFATLLPSTGTYALRPGLAGYPTAAGDTTYEARNADTATPREATVTVRPSGPPTVSVSASPSSCHPQKWDSQPCSVTCTANASSPAGDTLSYQWSGCASGTGSTGTCSFSQPGNTGTCTVTATDSKGKSATASQTVQSTNDAPSSSLAGWGCDDGKAHTGPVTGLWCNISLNVSDDDPNPSKAVVLDQAAAGGCQWSATAWVNTRQATFLLHVVGSPGDNCAFYVVLLDDWGGRTVQRYDTPVQ